MLAIEFQTRVEDGKIEVPEVYREQVDGPVRVIILVEEHQPSDDIIARLLSDPIQIDDFTPLTREEIYDRS